MCTSTRHHGHAKASDQTDAHLCLACSEPDRRCLEHGPLLLLLSCRQMSTKLDVMAGSCSGQSSLLPSCQLPMSPCRKLVWNFNLEGIRDMYESYEASNLWPFITDTAQGLRVHFVKAEHSTFRWAGQQQSCCLLGCCFGSACVCILSTEHDLQMGTDQAGAACLHSSAKHSALSLHVTVLLVV